MGDIAYAMHRMVYWTRDANLGYGQDTRDHIWPGGAADCSSLVIHVLKEAGFKTGSAWYTGDILENLLAHGWESVGFSDIQPGDVLLTPNDHVAMVLQDGETVGEAYINEKGTTTGGSDGKQAWWETRYDQHWTYRSWAYCLRAGASIRDGGGSADSNSEEDIDMAAINDLFNTVIDNWLAPTWKKLEAMEAEIKDHKENWLKYLWDKSVEVNATVRRIDAKVDTLEDVLHKGSRLKDGVWRPGLIHLAMENQKRINALREDVAEMKARIDGDVSKGA